MNGSNPVGVTKLALLIDGDNISATFMPLIMREAATLGTVAVRRIYGQFKSGKMKSWEKHVETYDLTRVNVSPLTRGKNATDMKLVIEAMDMLYGRQLDGFCIASSDGDFTPLAARVRANAVAAYGFGARKAPAGYKAEFDRFYECDTLLAAEKKSAPRAGRAAVPRVAPTTAPASRAAPAPISRAAPSPASRAAPTPVAPKSASRELAPESAAARRRAGGRSRDTAPKLPVPTAEILSAIDEVRESDGWSHLSSVSNQVHRRISDFSPKKHGHSTLKRLVAAMPDVETHVMPSGAAFVRRRQR